MLELVPISNDNSCTACGHTREASEAFITESACPDCMTKNKVYPATSGYRKLKRKNLAEKKRKRLRHFRKSSNSSITGQQVFSWLGGIALILVIAIGFKTYQNEKPGKISIEISDNY